MKWTGIIISCFIIGIINGELFDMNQWQWWFIAIGWGVYIASTIIRD